MILKNIFRTKKIDNKVILLELGYDIYNNIVNMWLFKEKEYSLFRSMILTNHEKSNSLSPNILEISRYKLYSELKRDRLNIRFLFNGVKKDRIIYSGSLSKVKYNDLIKSFTMDIEPKLLRSNSRTKHKPPIDKDIEYRVKFYDDIFIKNTTSIKRSIDISKKINNLITISFHSEDYYNTNSIIINAETFDIFRKLVFLDETYIDIFRIKNGENKGVRISQEINDVRYILNINDIYTDVICDEKIKLEFSKIVDLKVVDVIKMKMTIPQYENFIKLLYEINNLGEKNEKRKR